MWFANISFRSVCRKSSWMCIYVPNIAQTVDLSRDRDRRISVNIRPSWSTQWDLGQPGRQSKTFFSNQTWNLSISFGAWDNSQYFFQVKLFKIILNKTNEAYEQMPYTTYSFHLFLDFYPFLNFYVSFYVSSFLTIFKHLQQ